MLSTGASVTVGVGMGRWMGRGGGGGNARRHGIPASSAAHEVDCAYLQNVLYNKTTVGKFPKKTTV